MKKSEGPKEPTVQKCSDKIWFILEGEKTTGPITTVEVESMIGEESSALIWWRGIQEWVSVSAWREKRDGVIRGRCPTFYLDPEKLVPKTLTETVEILKQHKNPAGAKLWVAEQEKEHRVFEIGALCEALGLKARKQTRVKIKGAVIIERENLRIIGKVNTISAGGVGITVNSGLGVAGELTLKFHCVELFGMAPVKAEVVFSKNGNLGLKFTKISAENRSEIISYIRQNQDRAA